jgi:hypothetical protein
MATSVALDRGSNTDKMSNLDTKQTLLVYQRGGPQPPAFALLHARQSFDHILSLVPDPT